MYGPRVALAGLVAGLIRALAGAGIIRRDQAIDLAERALHDFEQRSAHPAARLALMDLLADLRRRR